VPRPTSTHRCRSCGAVVQRWVGRCPECAEWNTLEAWAPPRARDTGRTADVGGAWGPGSPGPAAAAGPVPLASVDLDACRPHPTGLGEVDRVLGGGLLAGSVTLVFGEPGVGKSTLLLQVLASAAAGGRRVLLVSAEESATQVRSRAARLAGLPPDLYLWATADIEEVEDAAASLSPALVVVDSIQTVRDPEVAGTPGTLAQVRSCTDRLTCLAKERGIPVVMVGHVTKEGDLAGPRALEHLVDTVLSFEGDRHHSLRMLRAVKHRFGPTGEVGLFEMRDGGLCDVADPGPLLLGDRLAEVPGSAVTALLSGRRPLLVEIQALACRGGPGGARRTVQGVDQRRLAGVVAVLECRAGIDLGGLELFVSAAGGIRAAEPAVDLPMVLAVASTVAGVALPEDLVSFGEVGLAGEIRQVTGVDRRLGEAARLGFTRALVPAATPDGPAGMSLVRVHTVRDAVAAALVPGDRPALVAGTMQRWSTTAANL
jgi:DNA repair protein RadA/Sms